MKRLAIIPAKDKSVRVKKKNFIIINKKPIYKYTLNNLINSKLFNKVHISSNILVEKNIKNFFDQIYYVKNTPLRCNPMDTFGI